MIALLASIGLPVLCNFVGEFLILQGAAFAHFTWAAWAAIGVILSAAYMLWMYQRTFLGAPRSDRAFADLSSRDLLPLLPLLVLMIWLGSYTQSFLPPVSAATSHLLEATNMNNQYQVHTVTPRGDSTISALLHKAGEVSHAQ
jgi:NADH-quinone oxidoreductase subunit M